MSKSSRYLNTKVKPLKMKRMALKLLGSVLETEWHAEMLKKTESGMLALFGMSAGKTGILWKPLRRSSWRKLSIHWGCLRKWAEKSRILAGGYLPCVLMLFRRRKSQHGRQLPSFSKPCVEVKSMDYLSGEWIALPPVHWIPFKRCAVFLSRVCVLW